MSEVYKGVILIGAPISKCDKCEKHTWSIFTDNSDVVCDGCYASLGLLEKVCDFCAKEENFEYFNSSGIYWVCGVHYGLISPYMEELCVR